MIRPFGAAMCAAIILALLPGCARSAEVQGGAAPASSSQTPSADTASVQPPATASSPNGTRARVALVGEECSKQGVGSCNKIGGFLVPEAAELCRDLGKAIPEAGIDPSQYDVTVASRDPERWSMTCSSDNGATIGVDYDAYDAATWRQAVSGSALRPEFSRAGNDELMLEGDANALHTTAARLTASGTLVLVLVQRREKARWHAEIKQALRINEKATAFFGA